MPFVPQTTASSMKNGVVDGGPLASRKTKSRWFHWRVNEVLFLRLFVPQMQIWIGVF